MAWRIQDSVIRGEKPPEHRANSLYLEWFSEANGRVVIEGVDWRLDISAPVWRPNPQDEQQCARDAAQGLAGFLQKLTERVDWIRTDDGDIRHPLQQRCLEGAMELRHACDKRGLTRSDDVDLGHLLSEFQITGAQLAGALNSLAYGHLESGFIVASLKRALGHLHAAQAALEKVAPKNLVPGPALECARRELFDIREGILALMKRFRRND